MKIFYFCPDAPAPSGGVRRIYTHVAFLADHGYDARVLHHKKGYQYPWADDQAPISYLSDIKSLDPETVLVVPEGFPDILRSFPNCPKVVIALNPYHIFKVLPQNRTWRDYGVNWVLTPSRITAEFIQWSMGISQVYLLGTRVDEDIFRPDMAEKKQRVVFIRRKDTVGPLVRKILAARFGPGKGPAFKSIDNLHIKEYAAALRTSAVFLSTSVFEGVNRSILEAMACGCICVGFAGIGGRDYIKGDGPRQNFVLADGMDVVDLSFKLARTFEMIRENHPDLDRIRKNAFLTVQSYATASEEQSLLRFWEKVAAQMGA